MSMQEQSPLRIGVIATDPLRLAGLQAIVRDGFGRRSIELVETSASGALGISELSLVLLDSACTQHLIGLLAAFRRSRPQVKVIVVGGDSEHEYIQRVIGGGAKGYLTYSATESEVRMAIEVVEDGSVWAPRKVMARLLETTGNAAGPERGVPQRSVTDRELDVLKLLWEGQSNREIAEALAIDEGSVKAHLGRLMRKMGVDNRTALAMAAATVKLVGPKRG